jgi:hypothetical protein
VLLPAVLALSPLLLIPLSIWAVLRIEHFWEDRRFALQQKTIPPGFVFIHTQKNSAQGTLLLESEHLSPRPQVLKIQGEIILLVFPSGQASRAKESILSTLATPAGHLIKPEMIVLTQS